MFLLNDFKQKQYFTKTILKHVNTQVKYVERCWQYSDSFHM